GLLAQLDGGRRHRLAGVAIMAGARGRLGEAEFEPRRRRCDLVEDRERGGHDLRPDAVAGQDRDEEAVVGEHAMFWWLRSAKAKPDTATARAASSTFPQGEEGLDHGGRCRA